MKTKNHEELSCYLMEQVDYPVKNKLKRALILGSVEPDYNLITYLRGSIKVEKFRGHNLGNAHRCMETLIDKIETGIMSEVKRWYLLGKLIHYVADAFTFPHNKVFKGNLAEHCSYEKELYTYMGNIMQNKSVVWAQPAPDESLIEQIDKMHRSYLEERQGCANDCCYILGAVTLVFRYFSEEYAVCWNERIA